MTDEAVAPHRNLLRYLSLSREEISRLHRRCVQGQLTEAEKVTFAEWIWCQAYWRAFHYKGQDDETAREYAQTVTERLWKRWIEERNLPQVDNDLSSEAFE